MRAAYVILLLLCGLMAGCNLSVEVQTPAVTDTGIVRAVTPVSNTAPVSMPLAVTLTTAPTLTLTPTFQPTAQTVVVNQVTACSPRGAPERR
ncbi:MAG: hypothetical protein K8I60_18135 [Anaerolineae bacterium]|nr:hypothetical protein [Anaerolineae bacterium]